MVVVADAGPLEGFYIDVFLQKVQLSLEKVVVLDGSERCDFLTKTFKIC